jgi:hypothetical protein
MSSASAECSSSTAGTPVVPSHSVLRPPRSGGNLRPTIGWTSTLAAPLCGERVPDTGTDTVAVNLDHQLG